jgi:hypothetical protein
VLGAWKFQQGKFCNCGKSGLGFLGDFLFLFSAKEGFFSAKRGHTCEEERRGGNRTCGRRYSHTCEIRTGHTCEEVVQLARVRVESTCEGERPHV